MFSRIPTPKFTAGSSEQIKRLREALNRADAVVPGAGAGLSAAGFWPFGSPEEQWAWWSRHIMINRYEKAPSTLSKMKTRPSYGPTSSKARALNWLN